MKIYRIAVRENSFTVERRFLFFFWNEVWRYSRVENARAYIEAMTPKKKPPVIRYE